MQEYIQQLLTGLSPENLGCNLRFACTDHTIVPPGQFADRWLSMQFVGETPTESWLTEEALGQIAAIVVFANPAEEEQTDRICTLGALLRRHPYVAPPVLLVPTSRRLGAPLTEAQKEAIRSLVQQAFIDDVVVGATSGFALSFAVQAKLSYIGSQLSRLGATLQARGRESHKRDTLAASIEYATWQYLRSKCFHAIPRLRTNFVEDEHRVGGLQLGPKLGHGLFGLVRIATRVATENQNGQAQGHFCGMLIVNKAKTRTFRDLTMINNYLCLMGELNNHRHPNLSHLLAVIHTPKRLCVCTETCGMQTLFLALKAANSPRKERDSFALTASNMRSLMVQVCEATWHLHTVAKICHRDIKPENVTVSEGMTSEGVNVNVKLGGFELAMFQGPGQKCKTACGTLPFAAPEAIVTDSVGYDGMAADMWSLGILFMEVVAGLRSVEKALRLHEDNTASRSSRVAKPSVQVANTIRSAFDQDNFLDTFFEGSNAAAQQILPWLRPALALVTRTVPDQRLSAGSLRDTLRVLVPDTAASQFQSREFAAAS